MNTRSKIETFLAASKCFWKRVEPKSNNECWDWKGNKNREGYGRIGTIGYQERAHRFSWIVHNGPIKKGLFVCHHCDNPSCVNPNHLFLGTSIDNNRDRHEKGRTRCGRQIGIDHNMAKLNDDLVRSLYKEAKEGRLTQRQLSIKYKVSQSVVSRILNGKTWSHLNLVGRL
jgi:hypothetical protein